MDELDDGDWIGNSLIDPETKILHLQMDKILLNERGLEQQQPKYSELDLKSYNMYETEFFTKLSIENLNSFTINWGHNQQKLIFEQIVDSMTNQNFVPFIMYDKSIGLTDVTRSNYMIQILFLDSDECHLTKSKSINPKTENQICLKSD